VVTFADLRVFAVARTVIQIDLVAVNVIGVRWSIHAFVAEARGAATKRAFDGLNGFRVIRIDDHRFTVVADAAELCPQRRSSLASVSYALDPRNETERPSSNRVVAVVIIVVVLVDTIHPRSPPAHDHRRA
jgi:hypothetical protein